MGSLPLLGLLPPIPPSSSSLWRALVFFPRLCLLPPRRMCLPHCRSTIALLVAFAAVATLHVFFFLLDSSLRALSCSLLPHGRTWLPQLFSLPHALGCLGCDSASRRSSSFLRGRMDFNIYILRRRTDNCYIYILNWKILLNDI